MFEDLDPAVLNQADFKEDAVREEIVAPILKRLGYHPSGIDRVLRSKRLTHPFIRIGTRKHGVTIIPDYTLFHEEQALLVLDAKSPSEDVLDSSHVQQVYSYAIHPEIRCSHFALCNGRRLVGFHVHKAEPLIDLAFEDFGEHWEEIERFLGARYLAKPSLREFQPDAGLRLARMGLDPSIDLFLEKVRPDLFSRLDACVFSGSGNMEMEAETLCFSFDFPHEVLSTIIAPLPGPVADGFRTAMSRSPFNVHADFMLELDLTVRLGREVTVEHETFIPFIVRDVRAARLNQERMPDLGDIPPYVFRLRRAFEEWARAQP